MGLMDVLKQFWINIKLITKNNIVKYFKYVYYVLSFFSIILITVVYLYSPKYDVVKIQGTEVKRTSEKSSSGVISKDVYYIYTLNEGSPLVLRNEDAIFYIKFDSADLQTLAREFENKMVQVKYYGIRSTWFSSFPNVVNIELNSKNATDFSLFLWVNLFILFILISFVFFKVRKLQQTVFFKAVVT
jgi:hypothetical protein